jgi:hypothetical protein
MIVMACGRGRIVYLERPGTVSPSRKDASSGRYGSGRLVDGVRETTECRT